MRNKADCFKMKKIKKKVTSGNLDKIAFAFKEAFFQYYVRGCCYLQFF